jgi:hypothetical protein
MFEEADSLGVSQGQGRGFAQVFDSTYNPVFKEETARLIEKDKAGKKEIDKDISGLDATVWKKAQPALQEKMKELYSYTMQNHRNITKGNTPEKLEYQKLISDIQLFTKEQKLQEDLWIKQFNNVALDKKGTYAPEALDILQNYFDDPNLNDPRYIAELPLSFDPINHKLKVVAPMVKKIVEPYTLKAGFKDEQGNIIYDKVWQTAGPEIEKQMKDNWKALPESAKSFFETEDNYISLANSFREVGAQRNVKQPYVDPNQKQQDKLDFTITKKRQGDMSIPYGEEGSENKIFKKGKFIALNEVAGNFKETIPATSVDLKNRKAIPISVFGIWQGTNGDIIDDVYDGDFWAKGNQGSFTFTPKLVRTLPVFRPQLDSKGNPIDTKNFRKNSNGEIEILADTKDNKKRWIPVDNISLDENDVKSGKFRGINLSDNNVKWEQFVIGNYGKKLGNNQENFDVAMPFDEYKGFVVANGNASQELTNFMEVINNKDSSVLTPHSYSKGKQMYFGNEAQPQQTKKAPDSTSKKRVYTKDEQDEYNEYKSSLKKGVTPISIDKYFE